MRSNSVLEDLRDDGSFSKQPKLGDDKLNSLTSDSYQAVIEEARLELELINNEIEKFKNERESIKNVSRGICSEV